MKIKNIETNTIKNIAGAIRCGDLSVTEIAEWSIANRQERGEILSAYKTWDSNRFISEAIRKRFIINNSCSRSI